MKSYIGSLLIVILLAVIFTIGMSFSRLDILDDRKRLTFAIGDFILMFILLSLFVTGMFLIGWKTCFIGVSMSKNQENYVKIKEIQLNPRFCLQEIFDNLINQGVTVSWMDDNELDKDNIFEIEIDD